MSLNKKAPEASAPSLKYHRHGTWDMIDVPIAIRSKVRRLESDADRSRMPQRPSASQLLFNPKPPTRHPSISEVCSKFESFGRDSRSSLSKGLVTVQTSKSREFRRSTITVSREASADVQDNDAMNKQVDAVVADQPQLAAATEGNDDTTVDHIEMADETGVSRNLHEPSDPEPTSNDQNVADNLLEPLQAVASVDRSVSELFRIQEEADDSDWSCSSSDDDSVSTQTAINRVLSRKASEESGRINNPDDADLLQPTNPVVVEEDNHSDGISADHVGPLEDVAMAHDNDLEMDQVYDDLDQGRDDLDQGHNDLDEVGDDANSEICSDEPHSKDIDAPDHDLSSESTSISENVIADDAAYLSALDLSLSIHSGNDQRLSEPPGSPVSALLSNQAADPPKFKTPSLNNDDFLLSHDSADNAQDLVELFCDRSEPSTGARATVRDISALFRMQEVAGSSDSGSSSINSSSRGSSRGSHGRHTQHSAISKTDIQEAVRRPLPTADRDDDILNEAMRSLSLNFDSDTDSPSDPAINNSRTEARSQNKFSVRFGGESVAPQNEPRLDMFEYPLIKHGRGGRRRRIYLTVDLGAGIVRWGNGRRWLQIEHILQVRSGKETPVLKRRTADDVDGGLCLSLITRYRSLDLECKTVEERKAVQLTIMIQIIGYLRHHNVRAGWIRPRLQSS